MYGSNSQVTVPTTTTTLTQTIPFHSHSLQWNLKTGVESVLFSLERKLIPYLPCFSFNSTSSTRLHSTCILSSWNSELRAHLKKTVSRRKWRWNDFYFYFPYLAPLSFLTKEENGNSKAHHITSHNISHRFYFPPNHLFLRMLAINTVGIVGKL